MTAGGDPGQGPETVRRVIPYQEDERVDGTGTLDEAWADAMAACEARGALLYEVQRRWEPGVADGWYAMAIKDGWFWRQAGDTAAEALTALAADVLGPGGRPSQHTLVSDRVASR